MKRSDAVSKLEDFLIELMENKQLVEFVEVNGFITRALICDPNEKIIEFIEKEIGMLPPERELKAEGGYSCEWEPEQK